MTESMRGKWDARYRDEAPAAPQPCDVLIDYLHLLPASGEALDLAAGLGGNALYLAQHGLQCTAWDISSVAMDKLAAQAVANGVSITCESRDVLAHPPAPQSFDVIVVSRFLERSLCPAISTALRPAGLLFYQTFTREKLETSSGPSNPDFLLGKNELLRLFPELVVRVYREEGLAGDTSHGLRNEACLVAEKR